MEPLDDPWAPTNLIPLASLAMELDTTVAALARQLGEDVALDDIGMRCVTRATAHAVIAEQHAREAAQREREARARQSVAASSTVAETRARLQAQAAAQAEMVAALDDVGLPESALAVVQGPERDKRLRKKGRTLDEQMSGKLVFHNVRDEQDD